MAVVPPEPPSTSPASETGEELLVFVYGTLKEGFQNHAHFCRGALAIHPAQTWGRLHLWAPNIPILAVPEDQVLLEGTPDLAADVLGARRFASMPLDPGPLGRGERRGWRRIGGELAVFPDPLRRLQVLDALEGFRPRTRAYYARALVPVRVLDGGPQDERVLAAWAYVLPAGMKPPGDVLDTDQWPPDNDA